MALCYWEASQKVEGRKTISQSIIHIRKSSVTLCYLAQTDGTNKPHVEMLVVAISSDIYAPNKSIGSVFLIKLARNYLHKLSWNLLRFYLAVQACGEVIYVCIAAGLPNEQYAFICQTYIIWVNTSIDFAEYFKIRRPTVVCRNSYNIIRIIFNI